MPQDFTLGRAGLATSAGGDGLTIHLRDDDGWSQEGDRAQVSGILKGSDFSSLADLKAARDQLQGYGPDNTDEPVAPVTWVQDPSRDGFYRVLSVEVGAEASGRLSASSAAGKLAIPWRAELLRVPGWQAPRIENLLSGTVRVNSHAVAATGTILTWSPGVGAYSLDSPLGTSATITGADGAVIVLYDTSPASDFAGYPSYAVATADFYKGCARIETSADSGTSWRTVVGKQIINRPTYVRLSNSNVRATTSTTASKTEISVEWHDGSQWETAKLFRLTIDTSYGDLTLAPVAVTVLSNRPESVAIRLELSSSSSLSQVYLDVVVERGSRVVKCYAVNPSGPALDWGVELGTAELATDITGGIRATNDDAGGNKFVIATPKTVADTDNTNGKLRVNEDEFPFALACSIGGTVGSGLNETSGLVLEYLAAVNRIQFVGVR